ncbi:MAG: hypothetical protein IKQ88_05785 [Lachnospiraceae bacterium]|nr:hypothetical protein [Lachnospiraceae bacterium]
MKRIKVLLIMVLVMFSVACGNSEEVNRVTTISNSTGGSTGIYASSGTQTVEVKAFNISDFPYFYEKEAQKALVLWDEIVNGTISAELGHFVTYNVSTLKPGREYVESVDDQGTIYFGNIKNGRPDGVGVIIDQKETYIGNFKKGYYSGYGILVYPASSDTEIMLQSIVYEGEFKQGLAEGSGVSYVSVLDYLIENTRDIYTLQETLEKNGMAACVSVAYIGDFSKNEKSGKGCSYYYDGTLKYEGEFKSGIYNGKGKLYGEGGAIKYEGMFKDGEYNGKGKLYNEDGTLKYKGKFLNGDIK